MYLIHAGLLLGACFLYYWVLLRNETHFALNRWILLGCLAGSLALPLVTVPAGWSLREALVVEAPTTVAPAKEQALTTIDADAEAPAKTAVKTEAKAEARQTTIVKTENASELKASVTKSEAAATPPPAPATKIDWLRLLWWTYLAGVAIFGLHFLIQLGYLIVKLLRHPGFDAGGFHLVELEEDAAPYSFWNRVFLNPNRYDPETYHQIVQHEAVHVRQRHSLDLMLAELVVIVQWFNPFAWLYRRAIENNLEFLTDAEVLRQGEDPVGYQMSLVKVAAPNFPLGLTTSYNQNLLEKRIAMMKTKKSSLASGWKYLTILPVLLLSMMQFNAVAQVPPVPTVSPTATAASLPKPAPAAAPGVVINNQRQTNLAPSPGSVNTSVSNSINKTVTVNTEANIQEEGGYVINMTGGDIAVIPDMVELPKVVVAPIVEPVVNVSNADFSKARRSWTAEIEGNEVCFTFIVTKDNRQHLSTSSRCFPRADLGALPTGQMGDFKLARASGTVTFNGVFDGAEGLGSFNFVPDPTFKKTLADAGYDDYEDMELLHFFFIDFTPGYLTYLKREGFNPTERELFKLAIFGFSETDFKETLTSYERAGYARPDLKKMIELRIHGVNDDYINELAGAGYKDLSLDDVKKAKIHGLSARFVNDMASAGFRDLEFRDVINMSIHGISSEYVAELNNLGYGGLDAEEVVKAKIHGVSTRGLADLKSAGLTDLTLKQARDAAIHGVDAEYIRELADLGYTDISIEEAIKSKIHGVSKRRTGDLKKAGITDLTLKQSRDAAIHGVDEEYVRELAELGYTDLSIEDVIKAKIHGVSRRKIGDLRKAGLTNPTLKEAREAAIHGVNSDQVESFRKLGYTDMDFDDFVKARIHGVTPRFAKDFSELGFGQIPFRTLVKLKIHGVSPDFIKKHKREDDDIDDLIDYKIRRGSRN